MGTKAPPGPPKPRQLPAKADRRRRRAKRRANRSAKMTRDLLEAYGQTIVQGVENSKLLWARIGRLSEERINFTETGKKVRHEKS